MFYDESSDEIQSKLELFDVELIFLGQISRFYFWKNETKICLWI